MRRPLSRLLGLLAAQAAALALVVGYCVGGGDLAPDHGLERVGALTLHDEVPGLNGTGRPALVVLAGRLDRDCLRQLDLADRRRATRDGIGQDVDFVVFVPDTFAPLRANVAVRPDPDGALARRLALGDAAQGCRPRYVLLDPNGYVRYRTYDPEWAEHAAEQRVLLEALR